MMLSIDRTVPAAFDWIMLSLPWLGTNLTLFPIIAAFSLWLWRSKGRGDLALRLMVVVVGSLILNAVLKDVFSRPRPDLWPHRGQFQWTSYPSGHAIVGVSVYFTVARLLHRERGWRWPLPRAAAMLIVNLYSRMYLGVHWPTDIIGGALLGLVWMLAAEYAFRPFGQRAQRLRRTTVADPIRTPLAVVHQWKGPGRSIASVGIERWNQSISRCLLGTRRSSVR